MVFKKSLKKGLLASIAAVTAFGGTASADDSTFDNVKLEAERSEEKLKGNSFAMLADEIIDKDNVEDNFSLRLADAEFFKGNKHYNTSMVASRLFNLMFAVPGRFKRVQFLGAQRFGKHKVNYEELEWKKFDTQHFTVHAYDKAFVNDFVSLSELSYDDLSDKFESKFADRKVLSYIYMTRRDFEQTNFLPFLVPEGLGGFTFTRAKEKNRVVSLFEGDFSDWWHVWNHEYVHWHDCQLQERMGKFEKPESGIPLWLIEGTRAILRDATR